MTAKKPGSASCSTLVMQYGTTLLFSCVTAAEFVSCPVSLLCTSAYLYRVCACDICRKTAAVTAADTMTTYWRHSVQLWNWVSQSVCLSVQSMTSATTHQSTAFDAHCGHTSQKLTLLSSILIADVEEYNCTYSAYKCQQISTIYFGSQDI